MEVVAGDGVLATTSLPAYWIRRVPRSTSQPKGRAAPPSPPESIASPETPAIMPRTPTRYQAANIRLKLNLNLSVFSIP